MPLIIPPAPRSNSINDAADTFDWSWVGLFTDKTDYEYSLDQGKTWQSVTEMPLSVGALQVRLAEFENASAGLVAGSTQAF
ncbi:MAG: hypothetical protein HRT97_00860 [Moritella sp.]|uniref:hypothetical protein n=1 Tax=Moritella sp. TaxID=78556 RepID=UPI0025DA4A68|nr:hypothetical protein [Moritella sp.]NQZ90874.1 hypothetical protein [Moritella sp.]